MENLFVGYCHTPIGMFYLECNAQAVVKAYFADTLDEDAPFEMLKEAPPVLHQAILQITQYFAGQRQQFDLPLAPVGSSFYQAVWKRLMAIPYGLTTSYGALAADLGNAKASRAVGLANNRNPISIIIPCHRVIGADGDLVGYASGIKRKQWLLAWEKNNAPTKSALLF